MRRPGGNTANFLPLTTGVHPGDVKYITSYKQIGFRYHFVWDAVYYKDVAVEKTDSYKERADLLTNIVGVNLFVLNRL